MKDDGQNVSRELAKQLGEEVGHVASDIPPQAWEAGREDARRRRSRVRSRGEKVKGAIGVGTWQLRYRGEGRRELDLE